MRAASALFSLPVLALLASCSGGPEDLLDASSDATRDAARTDRTDPPDTSELDGSGPDASGDGATGCVAGERITTMAACMDMGTAPRTCLQRETETLGGRMFCDADRDGLADDFEDALGRAYAMAWAFNQGDGSHTRGDPESWWPDNIGHFVRNSRLIWRVDNDGDTTRTVLDAPTLDTLGSASIVIDGRRRFGADPGPNDGSNFWLCLKKVNGEYTPESQVASMAISIGLEDGVDLVQVVHPTGSDPNGRYVFVGSMVYFAYNTHSAVDTHEGDMEGAAAMVDLDSGRVVAAYFDRHPSSDDRRLMPLTGTGAVPAINPAMETTFGNVCDADDAARAHGVRFWDYTTHRHHVVAYVSTNGHAMYGYPGNTKILGAGCFERTIVRDTHNGDGYKFLPWLGGYAPGWTRTGLRRVTNGVHLRNVGEDTQPRIPWAAYHGQWGCQHETVAKAYPAPWDNARHCRRWVTHEFGTAPPFATANPSADCSGAP